MPHFQTYPSGLYTSCLRFNCELPLGSAFQFVTLTTTYKLKHLVCKPALQSITAVFLLLLPNGSTLDWLFSTSFPILSMGILDIVKCIVNQPFLAWYLRFAAPSEMYIANLRNPIAHSFALSLPDQQHKRR